jgi:hypothetical protein
MVSNYKRLEVYGLQISLMMMKILELDQLSLSVLLITKKTDEWLVSYSLPQQENDVTSWHQAWK